jgi:hypothetical protein
MQKNRTAYQGVSGKKRRGEENMRIAILFLVIVAFVSGCATSKKRTPLTAGKDTA